MKPYVLTFQEIDKNQLPVAGGKGSNLGELSKLKGIRVPPGFCVTTEAYKNVVNNNQELDPLISQLYTLKADDREKISNISMKIRSIIEGIAIPPDMEQELTEILSIYGENNAYAVRSSATAEDLPTASFAGQQDTFLNIKGKDALMHHISKCWASLFTDRAVTYRIQNKFDHRKVFLAVVIQKMIFPEASGIMFTADPVTSNRKVLSIDASFGLGEALVSGLVNADIYKVREHTILHKKISHKKLSIYSLPGGGTEEKEIESHKQNAQTLSDHQILKLEYLGRNIEAYFGCPQDIEWCLYKEEFYIVQSRPITTLYPVPKANDKDNHVYLSFGHRQMMTEAMKPLGHSFFNAFFVLVSGTPMTEAGDRLFMDVSHEMKSPFMSKSFCKSLGVVDVLMQKAFQNLLTRKDYVKSLHKGKTMMLEPAVWLSWGIDTFKTYMKNDPGDMEKLMAQYAAVLENKENIMKKLSGDELFQFLEKDFKDMKNMIFKSYRYSFAGAYASSWLNRNILKWLGEKNVADTLAQSVSNNVTSEMGLALLDVADVIRQYPEVQECLTTANNENLFEDLDKLKGGKESANAIKAFLRKYGMRCSAEIDITRTRWNENPAILIPIILSNIKSFEPGAHTLKFQEGLNEALRKEKEILLRLEKISGGKSKIRKTRKMISVLRNFVGYREYNKYIMVWYFWIIKQAFMQEADRLVQNHTIKNRDDIHYLTYDELRQVIKTNSVDYEQIKRRKEDYELFSKLTPPRLITSDGEIISGEYDTGNIPKGAIAGVPVSSGTVEGRARVLLKLEDAHIEEGDILVTTFTDPSWTPVFVSIKGLVTEVGGMMTHGAVVAREYGLPAIVGIDNATKLIKDGQKIRINGTEGYIEILG
ncbi:phosphoenolpyruvate synthase [Aminipila terrae]|uniref:Rifampicin phosphotransferase n=1 Tax=Aminipila terrae TaxID=2697030 RepID=A0A6P1MMN9_9FIRM|nr:phosphoenolpyruvate synthase [Aminipila terrae]QHI73358.1 phosphoenolpyruvate synthase [Aminipila terrae]